MTDHEDVAGISVRAVLLAAEQLELEVTDEVTDDLIHRVIARLGGECLMCKRQATRLGIWTPIDKSLLGSDSCRLVFPACSETHDRGELEAVLAREAVTS